MRANHLFDGFSLQDDAHGGDKLVTAIQEGGKLFSQTEEERQTMDKEQKQKRGQKIILVSRVQQINESTEESKEIK